MDATSGTFRGLIPERFRGFRVGRLCVVLNCEQRRGPGGRNSYAGIRRRDLGCGTRSRDDPMLQCSQPTKTSTGLWLRV